MKEVFGIHLPYGNLYIYGEAVKYCFDYMEDIIDCVEDACDYAQKRNMKIFYQMNPHPGQHAVYEFFKVTNLTKRYSVYSSRRAFRDYLNAIVEKEKHEV